MEGLFASGLPLAAGAPAYALVHLGLRASIGLGVLGALVVVAAVSWWWTGYVFVEDDEHGRGPNPRGGSA